MTDLNDLDTFIDITITNNNRIREKTKNIWNVFRRIFIGTKLTSVSYNSNMKNKKEFFEKYSKIITPSVLADLTEDMYTDYHINNNMSSFISDMYDDLSINDKLDLCISNDYMYRSLLPDSARNMFIKYTDDGIRNKIIKLTTRRDGAKGLTGLVNIYSTTVIDHLNSNYDESIISDEMISVTSSDDDLTAKYFNALSDDLFEKHVNMYKDAFIDTVFMVSYMNCYGAEKMTNKAKLFLEALLKIANHNKRETIYKKIFSRMESDDFTSNLLTFGSEVIADKNQIIKYNYGKTYFNNGCDTKLLLKENTEWFKGLLETYYPDKTDVINNLEEFLVSYDLLANI